MPSYISSSESLRRTGRRVDAPLRAVPGGPWGRALVGAVLLAAIGLGAWEAYWRSQWFRPSYRNSDGLWTLTHDRIAREAAGGTVVVGSSRLLFDIDLETWRAETGTLPIQLALEGTSARPFLAHVARDTDFAGLVVVGVTSFLFYAPTAGFRGDVLEYLETESPAQRAGQAISMRVLEPYVAFYNFDTAVFTVLRRQSWWPEREGKKVTEPIVRKLSNMTIHRHARMWERVELDPAYREIARTTWLGFFEVPRPEPPPPEEARRMFEALLDDVAADVERIRARGGDVVFVRAPSAGPFREIEAAAFPREAFWDALLARTDAVGIHFEDHADLADVELPEWSHIRAGDTPRFTRALVGHLRDALDARGTPRRELTP